MKDEVTLTRTLLSIDTTNPPGNETECAHTVGAALEAEGLRVTYSELAPGRSSLIATLDGGNRRPPLCFTGHLDTVRLGDAPWRHSPFEGEVDGDKLFGRGASDMKSGVAAMVYAAKRLAQTPNRSSSLVLIFTAGEETCCQGALDLTKSGVLPDSVGAIVVGEPTTNIPLIGHKGVVRFLIRTRGRAAHAAMPELGDNAIHKISDVVAALKGYTPSISPHPLLGPCTLNIGTISGGANINSVPDFAQIGIDIRILPGQDRDSLSQEISSLLDDDVEIEFLEEAASIMTDEKNTWLQEVLEIASTYLKTTPSVETAPFFTDASVLTPHFNNPPTVILGPGEPTAMHKTDEYCSTSKIEEAVYAYSEIAAKWCVS